MKVVKKFSVVDGNIRYAISAVRMLAARQCAKSWKNEKLAARFTSVSNFANVFPL